MPNSIGSHHLRANQKMPPKPCHPMTGPRGCCAAGAQDVPDGADLPHELRDPCGRSRFRQAHVAAQIVGHIRRVRSRERADHSRCQCSAKNPQGPIFSGETGHGGRQVKCRCSSHMSFVAKRTTPFCLWGKDAETQLCRFEAPMMWRRVCGMLSGLRVRKRRGNGA